MSEGCWQSEGEASSLSDFVSHTTAHQKGANQETETVLKARVQAMEESTQEQ